MKRLLFLMLSLTFTTYSQQEYILNANTNGQTFNTCQGVFLDSGGFNENYGNNENYTITFCPPSVNQIISLSGYHNIEGDSEDCQQDFLEYWYASSPGDLGTGSKLCGESDFFIESNEPGGCISFRFFSNNENSNFGWIAEVICNNVSPCEAPQNLVVSNVNSNTAVVSWSQNDTNINSWEYVILQAGQAPSPNTLTIPVDSNPITITNLNPGTVYCVYVRALCPNGTEFSDWSLQCFAAATVCSHPSNTNSSFITSSSALISWTQFENNINTWQYIVLPDGQFPNPNFNLTTVNTNQITINNLDPETTYCVHLRAICENGTDNSIWTMVCFQTLNPTPICGSTFTDTGGVTNNYSNNENYTTTICPDAPNSFVQVTFTQFQVETNWDRLYIFNGSINDAMIPSANGAGNGPCANLLGAGGWWGTQLAGQSITSSHPSGCLSFRFCSDQSIVQAGWAASINCISSQSGHIVTVQPFLDLNSNGIKDTGEPNFTFGELNYTYNGGANQQVYSPNGFFNFYVNDFTTPTVFDFSYNIFENYLPYFNLTPPVNQNVTINEAGITEIFYPIVQTNPYEDLRIGLVPLNAPRAGFQYHVKLIYSNDGPSTVSNGTITFTKDPALTFTNISDTNAVQNSDGFTLNFTDLLPFENRIINISFQVPNLPIVSINQMITTTASIVPVELDVTPSNNNSRLDQGVIAAYDPNDKTEANGRQIIFEDFDVATDELTYTIRFENEGNAEAFDVKIIDVLDPQIDETSIRMVDASHDYVLTRINNELEWFFQDINLPPSVENTLIGHGHITFKVKLKPVIQLGSIVPNYASIYFDTNPPIVTDVFETEFVEPLSSSEFHTNFSIYPNPTHDLVNIKSKNFINRWQILDIQGKMLSSNQVEASTQLQIDLSQFKSGFYLMKVFTNEGEAAFKLIKK